MAYDETAIRKGLLRQWENDDLCVLPYRSKRSGTNNEITEFILDFKNGHPEAIALASKLVLEVAESFRKRIQDAGCDYVLAAPPHGRGAANLPSEELCKALAKGLGVQYIASGLERIKGVQKAAYARPGERATLEQHLETIRYTGPQLNLKGRGLILFDDLLTRGDTSQACRSILTDATHCRKVIGIFLGRTQ